MTTYQIDQLNREIATLRDREARLRGKQATLFMKKSRLEESASRRMSPVASRSKQREIDRLYKELSSIEKASAGLSKRIAEKSKRLHSHEETQTRKTEQKNKKIAAERNRQIQRDMKERKAAAAEQKRLIREREKHENLMTQTALQAPSQLAISRGMDEEYDFFICHASEDKEGFVRKLASLLEAKGAKVWYDEWTLRVGDSLRREIDRGLVNSRFGVVVLSESFFKKEWPQKELDGLYTLETRGPARILPIWHKVSMDEVASYSSTLADKVALNTSLNSV